MSAAVELFLSNLRRTLSPFDTKMPSAPEYIVTAVNEPFINQKIGSCLVQTRIGQGAMSIVYKGKQDITDRTVAIKVLRAQLACDPSNVKRFAREAKAISRLSHPNLIAVFEVGELKTGQPYMVMEYVEGRSFADVIAANGACPWQRAVPLFMQACAGMAHAHDHNIIHRDIKPDNVMLMKAGNNADFVKVVDFGIVKLIDESQSVSQKLTQTGEVWGSPVYMSPEQCTGKTIDARSDIYALGITMYECLMGRQLFDGKRITDVIMKQLNQRPEPFASVRPDLQVPAWLEAIVMKALEKDPAMRFQSMEDMRLALERNSAAAAKTGSSDSSTSAGSGSSAGISGAGNTPAPLPLAAGPRSGVIVTAADSDDEFINCMIDGKFLVQSKLGDGGMSIVYKAYHQAMDRFVAIKIIRDELCGDDAYKKRLRREAKALSSLVHPNLVKIFDVGTAHTGQSYIVMEYLDGIALSDLIDQKGVLPPKRVVPIFIQVSDVMNFLHESGIIHRDIKPHNIMVVDSNNQKDFVKVVDFGILKYDDLKHAVSQRLTATGDICGSPVYMSPEQILDEKPDSRMDIYALGVSMYESITGDPPFVGKRVAEVLNQHLNVDPRPFSVARPDLTLPPSLEKIVARAMTKKRDERYQRMSDVRDDLIVLNGRLEQELTCVMNGQSVGALPPLPVAGYPAVPHGANFAADSGSTVKIVGSKAPPSLPAVSTQQPSSSAAASPSVSSVVSGRRAAPAMQPSNAAVSCGVAAGATSGAHQANNKLIAALAVCVALLVGACIALGVLLFNKNGKTGEASGGSSRNAVHQGAAGFGDNLPDADGSLIRENIGEVTGIKSKSNSTLSRHSHHHGHRPALPTETLPEVIEKTERANLYRHKSAETDHWGSAVHPE